MLGQPEGGWPKVLQKIVLDSAGAKPIEGRPGEKMPKVDFEATQKELAAKTQPRSARVDVLSFLMYPQVYPRLREAPAPIRQHQRDPHARVLLWHAERRRNRRRNRAGQNAHHPLPHHRRAA